MVKVGTRGCSTGLTGHFNEAVKPGRSSSPGMMATCRRGIAGPSTRSPELAAGRRWCSLHLRFAPPPSLGFFAVVNLRSLRSALPSQAADSKDRSCRTFFKRDLHLARRSRAPRNASAEELKASQSRPLGRSSASEQGQRTPRACLFWLPEVTTRAGLGATPHCAASLPRTPAWGPKLLRPP